jgi:hypothetical protein
VDVSSDARPWWASDLEDGAAGAGPSVDPLEAHRAARRGEVPVDDPAWWDPEGFLGADPLGEDPSATARGAAEATGSTDDERSPDGEDEARGPDPADAAHGPDVCGVCPICLALRSLGESRPQLLEHLTEAARHLAAAARSLVDDPPRSRRDGPRRDHDPDPFERIDLD